MKPRAIILLCTLALVAAPCAWALDGAATVECLDGRHLVTVYGTFIAAADEEVAGLVFKREAIGVCGAVDYIPEVPLPFAPQPDPAFDYPRYEATLAVTPPLAGVAYRYTPFGVRADGTLVTITHYCGADLRSYALAACEGAPFARGLVEFAGQTLGGTVLLRITPCAEDCWTEPVGAYLDTDILEALTGAAWTAFFGQVVDVFGGRTYCTMAGGDYHDITGIALAPAGGCGPVPVQNISWDGLKAFFK